MKKLSLLFVLFVVFVFFSLVSCEKEGDVLKGTWKSVPSYNSSSSGATEYEMTYKFDGKGKYTFKAVELTGFVLSTANGSYTIEENNTIVRLQGVSTNEEGISKEYDSELMLDLECKPATLTASLYYTSSGEYAGALIFEKQ